MEFVKTQHPFCVFFRAFFGDGTPIDIRRARRAIAYARRFSFLALPANLTFTQSVPWTWQFLKHDFSSPDGIVLINIA